VWDTRHGRPSNGPGRKSHKAENLRTSHHTMGKPTPNPRVPKQPKSRTPDGFLGPKSVRYQKRKTDSSIVMIYPRKGPL
jgi:hypothetical protein